MLRLVYTLVFSLFLVHIAFADGSRYAAQSVLKEGNWVKIEVDSTGIYKLTYDELKGMGFSDPAKVTVYGYGGAPLEENFSTATYLDDLPQATVWRGDDYLLFYGKGPVRWQYDDNQNKKTANTFVHTRNSYSMSGFYFLTDSQPVKEAEVITSVLDGAALQIIDFDDYLEWERELTGVSASGRELFGESFESTTSRSFSFYLPGMTEAPGKATMRFISRPSDNDATIKLAINNSVVCEGTITRAGSSLYVKAKDLLTVGNWEGEKEENLKVTINYSHSGHKNARLDYFRLQMKRQLRPYGAFTFFRNLSAVDNVSRFTISEATNTLHIFDVTDGINMKEVKAEQSGNGLAFTIPKGELREFVMVQTDKNFPSPIIHKGFIENQDLHGLEEADMVIISPAAFTKQAERLKAKHEEHDGLKVHVVDPKQIYNEFSSGTPDATAYRRFMKMFYDRGQADDHILPRYLLLFGDGIYDNRGLSSDVKSVFDSHKNELLLTFQSENSIDDLSSYATDDYYGFLDDNSGSFPSGYGYDVLRLGIGRLPVRTVTEATQAVDKIIAYIDNELPGAWKNRVCFVADDGNAADSYTNSHMDEANMVADTLMKNNPEYLVNKLYVDAFKKDFSGGSTTYPGAEAKLLQLLKNGLFMINYSGHGNTEAWADEKILTAGHISRFTFPYLPLWITATCDFTRFDDPNYSAGERIFLHPTSGGIALFTTTRVVSRNLNFKLNEVLTRQLFLKDKDGLYPTLGDVMRNTKVARGNESNKLNFILIGDPAMKLNYPKYSMKVTTIDGEPVGDDPVTLKALAKVTIEGDVLRPDQSLAEEYNGVLNPTVLDSRATITCLNNNGVEEAFQYIDYPNTLYTGNGEVKDGHFSFTFTVPKDIAYSNDFGKLNLYAKDETTGIEANGAYLNFKVGGTSDVAENDTIGPRLRQLYLNDTTFVDGAQVNNTPLFVARMWDESGVNISGSSIGHDMTLVIDSTASLTYVLNSYYESILGSDGEGQVVFPIPALAAGHHVGEFTVWDVQNNSTRKRFNFEVVEGLKPDLSELVATPNPAREQVEFRLKHNRPEAYLTVSVLVYDMAGRLMWKHEEAGSSDLMKSYIVTWDLTDNNGARMRPGVYFYRAAIRTNNSKEATKSNKLIILAQ